MTERRPYPWVVPDLFRWFGLLGLSAAALCVAWWCASGTTQVHSLVTWINVGVVGVVVGGLGNVTWLLQGRRAVTARQRELAAALAAARPDTPPVSAYPDDDVRVAVPGTTRHHRPGCVAVTGKNVERASWSAHERAGRRPCGLCEQ